MSRVVGVNCRVLAKPTLTGVGRHTLELLDALADRAPDDELSYLLFGVESLPDRLSEREAVENAGEPAWAHSGPRAHVWEQLVLPRTLARYDVEVLHTPAGHASLLGDIPKVTTVHDLSPVVHPEWFSFGYATLYRALLPATVRASDELVTVSEFSAERIRSRYDRLEESVHAVPNGVTEPPAGRRPDGFVVPDRFFLFVGAINPRKNISGLLRAYREYREEVPEPASLLLVGPDSDNFAAIDADPGPGVRTTGYVGDAELGWLYRNALAFVYPSLYEGFGMPILEAMSVGTPVVTSDRGAMAETAGDAALLVDPESTGELAAALGRLDGDGELVSELSSAGRDRAREFTWERAAARTVEVYRAVLDR